MKNLTPVLTIVSRWSRYLILSLMLTLNASPAVYAQTAPSLSEVNDELEDQSTEVARTAAIIARILAIIATVLLIANIVFKKVEQSTAITTWFIVIFIWGVMEILF